MKNRIGVIVLVLVCVGAVIAVVAIRHQASSRQRQDAQTIETLSNKWVKTDADLVEQRNVAALLEKDLDTQKKAYNDLTNNFALVSSNFAQVSLNLTQAQTALKTSEDELKKRDSRIAELESQNAALEQKALDLTNQITGLSNQIADTRKQLAASEGDKAFLESQLKRLLAEKAELERQFKDLNVLRAQVAKLKEEMIVARRLEWARLGLLASAEQKGAQRLMQGLGAPSAQAKAPRPNYDLNVEVGADGSVRVIPPLTTNRPATNPPPNK